MAKTLTIVKISGHQIKIICHGVISGLNFVLTSSNPGDLVLDPFSGTFTTSFVAQKYGRLSIGIDLEEEYIKIGLRRLNICKEYRGETLHRPCKSYEKHQLEPIENLPLFNHDKETSVHGYNS